MNIAPIACLAAILVAAPATAQDCGPDALGTSRVQTLAPGSFTGSFHYASPPFAAKEIALTFDDGPKPGSTERILDTLKRECVHATFFVVGGRARQMPELVRRAAAEGHTIGTHTWSHRDLKSLSAREGKDEIEETIAAVRAITGRNGDASLFRYPDMSQTPEMNSVLTADGQAVLSTDISPKDWRGDPPGETLERLKQLVTRRGRGIVLLHDAQVHTADFLPDFLAFLKAGGYRIVALEPAAPAETTH
jgi:peptidoglycan/xylan/chitin deacetylase (PgdA/CDA1 family)